MIFEALSHTDVCSSLFIVVAVLMIGSRVVDRTPSLRERGVRIAGGAFLLLVCEGYFRFGLDTAENLIAVVLRALVGAGIILGVSWIALPALSALARLFVASPYHAVCRRIRGIRDSISAGFARRRRRREQLAAEADWQRAAPERERREREEAAHKTSEAERLAVERQRREDARFLLLLTYDQHQRKLSKLVPRPLLTEYFDTYLADNHTIEQVEMRAEKLQTMLHAVAGLSDDNDVRFKSLAEINEYFERERQAVRNSNYDPEVQSSLIASLNSDEDREVLKLQGGKK